MDPKAFAKEVSLYRQTGRQDAGNVMDPNELREALRHKRPGKAAIKAWLCKEGSHKDLAIDDNLGPGESLSTHQRQQLFQAWADGWSSYASDWFEKHAE